jgi:hypothetical protein
MGLLSLCNMCGCDLTFVFPHFTSRDLRRDRFRQFPEARRFDTLWADNKQRADRWSRLASTILHLTNTGFLPTIFPMET